MRWLHRWNDAELGETRNVFCAENLRVLDSPARLGYLALVRRSLFERGGVKIEDDAIRAITDRMRLHLNATTQSLFEDRTQSLGIVGEKTGRVGVGYFSRSAAPREPSAPSA